MTAIMLVGSGRLNVLGPLQDITRSDGDPTSYSLIHPPVDGERVVSYDPCQPIRYVVNPGVASDELQQQLNPAVAAVEEATGLDFVYEGITSEEPSMERELRLPEKYGEGWAPVLIAFTDPDEFPVLEGDPAGGTSPQAVYGHDQEPYYVTGFIVLDTPELAASLQGDGESRVRGLVMHELAHLVGLDHVNDTTQLMNEGKVYREDFGAGDLAGLERMGSGQCAPANSSSSATVSR
ncbi:hypothetical protein [Kocuria arenosa]|uniref:hypothetical protein n=1 Tax=Kocuria arenosa TaxID=3071446 RepID=UPI0034D693A2